MKVITWNVRRSTRYLDAIPADVALLQECASTEDPKIVSSVIGGSRPRGSAIYAKAGLEPLELPELTHPATLVGAKASDIYVFSIYGLLDENGYSTTTLHRTISDLTHTLRTLIGQRKKVILGGDFNASPMFDRPNARSYRRAHEILFERLEDFGLVNVLPRFHENYVQTLRHNRTNKPWQIDHLFVSENLFTNIKSCEVQDSEAIRSVSDHNPIVCEFSERA